MSIGHRRHALTKAIQPMEALKRRRVSISSTLPAPLAGSDGPAAVLSQLTVDCPITGGPPET